MENAFNKWLIQFVRRLIKHKIIEEDEFEIYRYGCEVFCLSTVTVVSILIISAYNGNLLETVCYFLGFIPLRIYAGGYHANTRIQCFSVSIIIYFIFSLILDNVNPAMMSYYCTLSVIISWISIVVFAPVIHKNHSVSPKERNYYRKICIVICCVESALAVIGNSVLNNNYYVLSFCMGILAASVSILVSKMDQNVLILERKGNK